jgi:antitoxin YefM
MNIVNTIGNQEWLEKLMAETAVSHAPVMIQGKQHQAVLVGLEDWQAITETLYLLSIPNMRESIHVGMNEPLNECVHELLASRSIGEAQAADLRSRLAPFAEEWDSPEMDIYDNYDALKPAL